MLFSPFLFLCFPLYLALIYYFTSKSEALNMLKKYDYTIKTNCSMQKLRFNTCLDK